MSIDTSWKKVEDQYKKGETLSPKVKEFLDSAYFTRTKIAILVFSSLAVFASIGLFYSTLLSPDSREILFASAVILFTIGSVSLLINSILTWEKRKTLEHDKKQSDEPYLKGLLNYRELNQNLAKAPKKAT